MPASGLTYPNHPPGADWIDSMLAGVDGWLRTASTTIPGLAGFELAAAAAAGEHRWLEQDGELRHLAVHRARADRRGAVVFAHGLGDHVRRSLPLADALAAAGWDVVMPDRRGHGLSAGPRGDSTLEQDLALLALAATDARERFGGPVVLVGDSLGGIMTWYSLTRAPNIDAAVCHCIAHPEVFPSRALRIKAPLTRVVGRVAPRAPVPISQIGDYSAVGLEPTTRAYFEQRPDPLFNFRVTARSVASYAAFRPRPGWSAVEIPVLVTIGSADGLVAQEFVERCLAREQPPRTTYQPLAGLGHQFYLEHLDTAMPPLLSWLEAETGPAVRA